MLVRRPALSVVNRVVSLTVTLPGEVLSRGAGTGETTDLRQPGGVVELSLHQENTEIVSENELISSCLRGEDRAWTALIKLFEGPVAARMWRFSRDRAVCQELVQDVFVELYRSLPKYQRLDGVPLLHWVQRIATRVGYQYWKKQALLNRGRLPLEGFDRPKEAADPTDDPAAEAARLVHRTLAMLGPEDRLVLTLAHLEGCDTKQIAQQTGWNRAVVKMRCFRARQRLKTLIESDEGLTRAMQEALNRG
jgi:RNA polymerase sigma-70 factor, ECF subfamily